MTNGPDGVAGQPKERPILFSREMVRAILAGRKTQTRRVIRTAKAYIWEDQGKRGIYVPCRYGQPGDRLWVKEAWAPCRCGDFYFKEDHAHQPDSWPYCMGCDKKLGKWKSSLFMPRWASRITLEIIRVKVERLQDISEKDIFEEGFRGIIGDVIITPIEIFISKWDEIYSKSGFGWDDNPWVWAITFKRIKPENER